MMGSRMLKILHFLAQGSSECVTVKSIILGVEGLEQLPERDKTRVLYSGFSYSLNRLVHHGFITRARFPYSITRRGRGYLMLKEKDGK